MQRNVVVRFLALSSLVTLILFMVIPLPLIVPGRCESDNPLALQFCTNTEWVMFGVPRVLSGEIPSSGTNPTNSLIGPGRVDRVADTNHVLIAFFIALGGGFIASALPITISAIRKRQF